MIYRELTVFSVILTQMKAEKNSTAKKAAEKY